VYNYNNENVTCRKSEKPKKQREKNHLLQDKKILLQDKKKLQVLSLIYNKFEKQDYNWNESHGYKRILYLNSINLIYKLIYKLL